MHRLTGVTRHYPWGSRTKLAQLRGEEGPTQQREAELWFGAHPAAPATIDNTPLTEIIAADPTYALGDKVSACFDGQLPFLVKILAADEPLSLQAHPSKLQAKEGFARENDAGIPLDAAERNYRDDTHKPEVIVALSRFEALTGFRPVDKTRQLFDVLNLPELEHYTAILDGAATDHDEAEAIDENSNLRALFTTWITIPHTARAALIDAIVAASVAHLDRGDWISEILEVVVDLNERYPGDAGVLGALLLNHVVLEPGEALYTEAGQLHAYLEGIGVEVMANSDNVLRGGLTSKYVDVPELVRVLNFRENPDPRIDCDDTGTYVAPVGEYRLRRLSLPAGGQEVVESDGPTIVLCVAGSFDGISAGEAVWIPAGEDAQTLTAGDAGAELFIATA